MIPRRLARMLLSPSMWTARVRLAVHGVERIPTHLTTEEKVVLHRLARSVASRPGRRGIAAEIGSYLGASALAISTGLGRGRDVLICIDTWKNDAMSEGARDTFHEFRRNVERQGDDIIPIRGLSTDPAIVRRVREHGPIDLLFLDGDHNYTSTLADWRAYRPLLAPGAWVALHDIGWAEGVQRVVREEVRPLVSSEDRLPNLWWGRMCG